MNLPFPPNHLYFELKHCVSKVDVIACEIRKKNALRNTKKGKHLAFQMGIQYVGIIYLHPFLPIVTIFSVNSIVFTFLTGSYYLIPSFQIEKLCHLKSLDIPLTLCTAIVIYQFELNDTSKTIKSSVLFITNLFKGNRNAI